MTFSNPLQPIYDAFVVASDCFRVARRTVDRQHTQLLSRTRFVGATVIEANTAVKSAAEQASDLAILALFTTFERWVIQHLQRSSVLIAGGFPSAYAANLASKFSDAVEWWKVEEILDLFQIEVDPQLIMRAKQIKKYRDWIAHRNPRKAPPANATPEVAFEVLSELIEQIWAAHTPPPPAVAAAEAAR